MRPAPAWRIWGITARFTLTMPKKSASKSRLASSVLVNSMAPLMPKPALFTTTSMLAPPAADLPDGGIHQLLTGDVRHQMVQTLYALRPAAQLIYRIARRLQCQSRLLSDTGGSSGDNRYLTHALPAPPP